MKRLIEYINKTENIELLKKRLNNLHLYDISQILLELDKDNRSKIYKIYNDEELADIFSFLDEEDAVNFLKEVSDAKKVAIINEMEPDDATDVIQEAEGEEDQNKILNLLDKDLRDDIAELKEYKEYTAGSIMTTHFVSVLIDQDIKLAMKSLVNNAPDVESINTIFIVDENDTLKGTISLKELIIAKSPCLVNDIMNDNYKFVDINTDIEEATRMITDYDIYDLPVLDNGKIKGIITMDDAIDNMVDEASEDYARLAGLTTDQEKDESYWESIKKRIPWLIILLVFDLFVPIITSAFDYLFAKPALTILVLFQPVILGLAGNSAMQSLGIAIRSISNKSLDDKNGIKKHLSKELLLGVMLGITLGILCFFLTWIMLIINKTSDINILMVALTVGLSTTAGLLFSNITGALIPIIFYKCKLDPAVASGPFITTIIDIISVVIYFLLATILLYNFL